MQDLKKSKFWFILLTVRTETPTSYEILSSKVKKINHKTKQPSNKAIK